MTVCARCHRTLTRPPVVVGGHGYGPSCAAKVGDLLTRRYCYEHEADAREALLAWDGSWHPGGPWIKCKGTGIDLLNPALCEVLP